jgi:hypothetical protein
MPREDDRDRRDAVDRLAMATSQQSKRLCFIGSTRDLPHRRLCAATSAPAAA